MNVSVCVFFFFLLLKVVESRESIILKLAGQIVVPEARTGVMRLLYKT